MVSGAAVDEQLACSPPTKVDWVRFPAGLPSYFPLWNPYGFLGGLHSDTNQYSPHSTVNGLPPTYNCCALKILKPASSSNDIGKGIAYVTTSSNERRIRCAREGRPYLGPTPARTCVPRASDEKLDLRRPPATRGEPTWASLNSFLLRFAFCFVSIPPLSSSHVPPTPQQALSAGVPSHLTWAVEAFEVAAPRIPSSILSPSRSHFAKPSHSHGCELELSEEIWEALNIEVLRADDGVIEMSMKQRRNERRKREIQEKARPPVASSGTIPTSENLGANPPGIEPGSPIFIRLVCQRCVYPRGVKKHWAELGYAMASAEKCNVKWKRERCLRIVDAGLCKERAGGLVSGLWRGLLLPPHYPQLAGDVWSTIEPQLAEATWRASCCSCGVQAPQLQLFASCRRGAGRETSCSENDNDVNTGWLRARTTPTLSFGSDRKSGGLRRDDPAGEMYELIGDSMITEFLGQIFPDIRRYLAEKKNWWYWKRTEYFVRWGFHEMWGILYGVESVWMVALWREWHCTSEKAGSVFSEPLTTCWKKLIIWCNAVTWVELARIISLGLAGSGWSFSVRWFVYECECERFGCWEKLCDMEMDMETRFGLHVHEDPTLELLADYVPLFVSLLATAIAKEGAARRIELLTLRLQRKGSAGEEGKGTLTLTNVQSQRVLHEGIKTGREPDSIPGGVVLGFLHLVIVPRMMPLVGGFPRGYTRFPPLLHFGATPYSPLFTLIDSQELDIKIRPNFPPFLCVTPSHCDTQGNTIWHGVQQTPDVVLWQTGPRLLDGVFKIPHTVAWRQLGFQLALQMLHWLYFPDHNTCRGRSLPLDNKIGVVGFTRGALHPSAIISPHNEAAFITKRPTSPACGVPHCYVGTHYIGAPTFASIVDRVAMAYDPSILSTGSRPRPSCVNPPSVDAFTYPLFLIPSDSIVQTIHFVGYMAIRSPCGFQPDYEFSLKVRQLRKIMSLSSSLLFFFILYACLASFCISRVDVVLTTGQCLRPLVVACVATDGCAPQSGAILRLSYTNLARYDPSERCTHVKHISSIPTALSGHER
ncbi:hypothetical protein PR048_020262 [Dryococelus australis]|uniref:RNase III domain-containing protein n=1 Tax=Dryococelus australis TaxID=614101 RepID=A0ABQ9H5U4_9NEOP|nr:hypothetical protein PR048_020262 [Dryococelus australis]